MKNRYPKIILIGALPPPNHGVNVYFQSLVSSKIRQCFHIHHIDLSDHRDLNNLAKFDFMNVYLALKHILQLVYALIVYRPTLVYLTPSDNFLAYFRDGLFIYATALFSNAKIVAHLHSGHVFNQNFYQRSNYLIKKFIESTLKKVSLGIVLGDTFIKDYESFVRRIVVIPNGIDSSVPLISPDKTKTDKICLGYLGLLIPGKGITDLIDAIVLLDITVQKKIEVFIAGSWIDKESQTKEYVLREIKNHGLSEVVSFLGYIEGQRKEDFFSSIDIFVFPSWYDSFGIVILEAMAAGCAVITTKGVGAMDEVVVHGATGLTINPQKPKELAAAISQLVVDKTLLKKMGETGRKRFHQYYTLEKNIDLMVTTFNKVISNSEK